MPKGYWIGRVDVTDAERYKEYVASNGPAVAAFQGRYLARGGRYEATEGVGRARNVIVEFPSYQMALDCYHSPAYQTAKAHRVAASTSEFLIVEGYDGPQPT